MSKLIITNDGVKSANGDKFVYCSYWGTWSRLLKPLGKHYGAVEVNLTAINPTSEHGWVDKVSNLTIRVHRTPNSGNDRIVDTLPLDVYQLMSQWLSDETVERLINEDFISQIDFDKYRKHCNGGAAFELIKQD